VTIRCSIEGCASEFSTEEVVSPNATFICRHHPRAEQVKAAGRLYDSDRDERDKEIRFQEHSFDSFFSKHNRWQEDAEIDDTSDI